MVLKISTVGALEVSDGITPIVLPSSRKARALLAYLVLSGGKHSRQFICEMLWDRTDDPLAALRWSLSKLRPIVNRDNLERLGADRRSCWFNRQDVLIDRDELDSAANMGDLDDEHADRIWQASVGVLLEDCELPNQPDFMIWLEGQRNDYVRLRARLARKYATDPNLKWQIRDKWAERWLSVTPYSREAAKSAYESKYFAAGKSAAAALAEYLERTFEEAGIKPPEFTVAEAEVEKLRTPVEGQEIRFVESRDGVTIAWASFGNSANPPLVKAANWLNHLELDWDAPIWSPLLRNLSRSHRVIRYDERGCGLSDWDVEAIGFEQFVDDLEQVVDAVGLDRFPLLGISQGAAVSIAYAARHPERVSKLILFGAYDCGWRHFAKPEEVREREAVMVLTETGWGSDNPAYRHLFSRTFMPDASAEEFDWFDEFQRQTTSPANAVRFLEAFSTIDVRDCLPKVQCPTLVVHSRGDMRIPFATGRSLAARIPDARLASVDSSNHLLIGHEKASEQFVQLIRDFLVEP
ncbi:MAG: alpha/beta fold hydrolase [Pseudomonadota bacterium]